MEVVKEPVVLNSVIEDGEVSASDTAAGIAGDADPSHRSNGVADAADYATDEIGSVANVNPVQNPMALESTEHHEVVSVVTTKICESVEEAVVRSSEVDTDTILHAGDTVSPQDVAEQSDNGLTSRITEEISELFIENTENTSNTEVSLSETNTESSDTVTFKTEVLVERNDNDGNETVQNEGNNDDASKHILSALRQNLELSDVLQSDVTDNMENNNSSTRQEVLNKEELLDILEGNDVKQADDQFIKIMQVDHSNIKTIEAQLALQQLTRLKSSKSRRIFERMPRKKKNDKKLPQNNSSITEIKTKKDKKPSETSASGESENVSEDCKGKKDKKNSGASKTSEALPLENKKDEKGLEADNEETVPTELKSKKEKQTPEHLSGSVESPPSETKAKRSRKTVDNATKILESSVAENRNKKEIFKASIPPDNAETTQDIEDLETLSNKSNCVKENIVNVLVRDWEDDEHESFKDDAAEKLLEETTDLGNSVEQLVTAEEVIVDQERIDGSSMDSSASFVSEGQTTLPKSGDEGQPQRRLGRVIKKKVIFDPDNPDTFTKGKLVTKNKDTSRSETEKELPTPKKSKVEVQQIPKAKSPTGKLQWKKPPPKTNKQNKRLTEVDKLLMDEGAVNMIYQLTPEAPKGKKNMRTKAEFIKKIQSSTPDSKEMKFRERKKETVKSEDAEAKKIVGGKQRGSLSSSVKSMSICEDFEAHSADDSIIYRRHSSSSYSSNCMSPLRVNDPESSAARVSGQASDNQNEANADDESIDQISDVFMSEVNTASPNEVINKSDCLSIKQKLNSKLSHVLNKRKRENVKTDKPAKQKRLAAKTENNVNIKSEKDPELAKIKTLTVKFEHNLAEICVKIKGNHYDIQTLKDLELVLTYIDSKEDITVTLLTSECGTLCSSLDLRPILDENLETRTVNAFSVAECIRSLLSTVERHSKLLCTGAWGACWGLGLALAALSDVALASERATFALDAGAPLVLAAAALTTRARLPRPLVDNLMLFGRQLSAEEALRGGLLSRVLWPARPAGELRAAAAELARQPAASVLLKKQLLTLNRGEQTFQSCLEAERNLVVDYWTSAEGQEALRASFEP